MNKKTIVRNVIVLGIAAIAFFCVYFLFVSHKFVQISLSSTTASYELVSLHGAEVLAEGTGGGIEHVSNTDYLLRTFDEAGRVNHLQIAHGGIVPFTKITADIKPTKAKAVNIFMRKDVSMVTPLFGGYLYKNNVSQAVEYINDAGIINLSKFLGIKTLDIAEDNTTYNTVVGIFETEDGVLVATTKNLFVVRDPGDIEPLPLGLGGEEPVNIYRVSYDPSTNTAFFLNTPSNTVYRYNVSNADGAFKLYTPKTIINQIASNGSTAAVYYDNVASNESGVIKHYQDNAQVTPIFIDAKSGEVQENNFGDPGVVTSLSLSENGTYAAYRTKYKNFTIIQNLSDNTKTILPASTIGEPKWIGNVFYIASNKALWSFDPQKDNQLQLVSQTEQPIREFSVSGSNILLGTTTNYFLSSKVTIAINTADLKLSQPKDYIIDFYVGNQAVVTSVFCPGSGECAENADFTQTINGLSDKAGLPVKTTYNQDSSENYIYQL